MAWRLYSGLPDRAVFGLPALDVTKHPTQEGGRERRRGTRIFATSAPSHKSDCPLGTPRFSSAIIQNHRRSLFFFFACASSARRTLYNFHCSKLNHRTAPSINILSSDPIRSDPPRPDTAAPRKSKKKFTPSWRPSSSSPAPSCWGRGGARPMPWPAACRCIPKTLSIPGCRRARPWRRRRW